jgi:hypothetical protein
VVLVVPLLEVLEVQVPLPSSVPVQVDVLLVKYQTALRLNANVLLVKPKQPQAVLVAQAVLEGKVELVEKQMPPPQQLKMVTMTYQVLTCLVVAVVVWLWEPHQKVKTLRVPPMLVQVIK